VTNFDLKNESELAALDDEALLAYYGAAREAGHPSAEGALGILCFRYFDDVHRRCRLRVPPADAEDVAMEAIVSAIRSRLDGRSIGEFRTWLNRIVGRRIADYTRKPGPDTTALPEEHADDERIWGASGSHPPETGKVEIDELVERALDGLSEQHREVIEVFVFEDRTAADTCEAVNAKFPDAETQMRIDNVSKIAERFRTRLRELLEESDNPRRP
jgi:RNA polymerase sigma factor (sigma-70 family)